tara:strand:+ start:491 stop:790 length:300 start_codon:yes stop_codon:yes gene_type:complete
VKEEGWSREEVDYILHGYTYFPEGYWRCAHCTLSQLHFFLFLNYYCNRDMNSELDSRQDMQKEFNGDKKICSSHSSAFCTHGRIKDSGTLRGLTVCLFV